MDYNDSIKMNFNKNIKNIKNNNIIKKSKNEIIDEIKNIFKEKRKNCNHCNTHFDTMKDLRNHILTECANIEIINTEIEKDKKDDNILNTNHSYNTNQSYNSNSNNITINIISNNVSNKLMSFDKEWDTSHLNHETKLQLFLSTMKFTKTLEYILKNDANLNVLLDKENEYGYIYKDTDEKIHKMKRSDIIDESFGKLYNHLHP
jgi:hypothetical protein